MGLCNGFKVQVALCFSILMTLVVVINCDNPIVQTEYTADPAPLIHDGRFYVFAGHDEDNSTWYTMKEWLLYSSDDMANWQHHGSPMNLNTFSWADQDAWAGQAIFRDNKFFFYVPVRNKATGNMAIGVGVSDTIIGPYVDAIGKPLIENGRIDPTVFIDDDGEAYMYWGNPDLWYLKLNPDMVSYTGEPIQVNLTIEGFGPPLADSTLPTAYAEAPWLYKKSGLYYMVYAAVCCPEDIRYATGPSATGPWTYRGVIMTPQGSSFTNHPGIVEFHGVPYFVYHNGALPGGGGYTRSVAIESFAYNSDSSIPSLTMTTAGPSQIRKLDPYVRQEAETIAWAEGVETEECSEGGMNVGFISNGAYIKVKGVAFDAGAASFAARVASASNGGAIELRLDSETGPIVGTCRVPGTGGWQTWVTVNCPVTEAADTHDLFFRFIGDAGYLFNINWWQFERGTKK